ncbi:MAG: aminoacyl-histidine dipeptidase [Tissierellia bacterium]|nr:aminoacyl-histidine dipeptidase [Tissierellia bacterium]
MEILDKSRASKTFDTFFNMNQIPRCSNAEEAISNFLYNFGKNLGLETIKDENLNVLIKKPASPGYEDHDTVCLQGHMDMVCEKLESCNHDFSKDPIDMFVDGDWIKAKGTTLGADDGIGVAMALDLLASDDIRHPALEVLITSTEETGMDGALGLTPDFLQAKKLINIDTEDEGVMIIGCAGGIGSYLEIPLTFEKKQGYVNKKLVVSGLKGGHSGLTIGTEHLNAIKLLVNVISKLKLKEKILTMEISGGTKHNAIPSKAEVTIGILEEDLDEFENDFEEVKNQIINQYLKRESALQIDLLDGPENDQYMNCETVKQVFSAINLLPHGINTMVKDDETMVESSNNLAIVEMLGDKLKISLSIRSSDLHQEEVLIDKIKEVARFVGAQVIFSDGYPMWKPNFDSPLTHLASDVYKKLFDQDILIKTIHAGLETGLIAEKYPEMDMISIGPDITGAHTPDEKLSISSTEKTRDFLVEILANL